MRTPPATNSSPHRTPRLLLALLLAVVMVAGLSPGRAEAAGRTLWVATWGDDYAADGYSTRPNSMSTPWRTIARTIDRAQPGDTIVVRGGTYVETVGWGAVPATSSSPIVLTNHQDERVVLQGHLQLKGADHWTVDGINVTYDPGLGRTESLVAFIGGRGWQLLNSEIWGTRGVSNLMVREHPDHGTADVFRIANNCIHSNLATGDALANNHNIYLWPGLGSDGGMVERNLLFGAPNGANIKAGGPNRDIGSNNVVIRFNTMAKALLGLTIPYVSSNHTLERNLVTHQVNGTDSYRMGIFGAHLSGSGNTATDNGFFGYPVKLRSGSDSTNPIVEAGSYSVDPAYDGMSRCGQFRPTDEFAARFGHLAKDEPLPEAAVPSPSFDDIHGSPFGEAIRWLAAEEVTRGCNPPENSLFCPEELVTRAQMAVFLRRALDLPPGNANFSDVPTTSPYRDAIAALADAGVTRGCNPPANSRFCPDDPVTRAQMAAFLTRALGLPPGSATFSDVGGVFADDIASLASAGVTKGCNPPSNTNFCPGAGVTRGQMAAFLYRALG